MIKTNTGFLNQSKTPLDSRQVVDTLDDLLALDTNILYNGIQVYVNELDVRYQYHEDYNETSTGNWKLSTGGGGEDAVIPHIGDNGNWYIGENDTGVPATGQDGMSAYEVAVAFNGFEGTEEEWLESLKGEDGKDGTTYTPSIGEVTTVDSTELASASVSVNTETNEAVFNFAIPKGEKGADSVQISDNETVENKTWSSKKTSDEIADIKSALDELENITRLTDFDEAIPEIGKNKIYYVNKSIGTYKCAQWRVESMYYDVSGAKQYRGVQKATSINGVDNIMLMREYYLDNNVMHWSAWKELATMDKVADVGVTTITPVDSHITGNIEYEVKNGICYVSMKDLMSTISSTNLLISTTMPKPSINCTASSVTAGGNIAMIYIDKNTTNLRGNFYTKNAKSDCSFSYPVAEN